MQLKAETKVITVADLNIEVVRKDIKNLYLSVHPPHGRVRVAAPLWFDDDAVRLAVIGNLRRIKQQIAQFAAQPRQTKRDMVDGENHYFLGRCYRLHVYEQDGPARVAVRDNTTLDLFLRPGATVEQREAVLRRWYRDNLKAAIPPLLQKWQPVLGVRAADWGIKRMKTRWGSCNTEDRRIWLNLELAKKPLQCIEYVVVHELVHLLERHHNDRFFALMDTHLPRWRFLKDTLNQMPLAHEEWR